MLAYVSLFQAVDDRVAEHTLRETIEWSWRSQLSALCFFCFCNQPPRHRQQQDLINRPVCCMMSPNPPRKVILSIRPG